MVSSHGANLQRFIIDANVYLAPDAPFGPALLAGVPLAFTLGFDACTIDQNVQRAGAAMIGQANVQRSLTAAKGAAVGHRPLRSDQPRQAFHDACRLLQRQAKQHLYGQAGLNCSVAELALPPALAAMLRRPNHLRIEPY